MLITKTSTLTGKVHTMDIPCTQEQIDSWRNGELIQNAMPNLDSAQREFLISGCVSGEWDDMFEEEEEGRCESCGGIMHWCDTCKVWVKHCCTDYGTCQCS